MGKLNGVRVFEIQKFKAISSGLDTPENVYGKVNWIWAAESWVTVADAAPHELIEFAGGIYVVGVADENEPEDCGAVYQQIVDWIEQSENFVLDDKPVLFHRIGCGEIEKVLGMAQQEMFVPVKLCV